MIHVQAVVQLQKFIFSTKHWSLSTFQTHCTKKKEEKLCIKDGKKNVKYLKFAKRHQMTSKRYTTCVLIKGNIVYIFFSPTAFSEYKACVAPACTDVTMDKSIGTIDPFSLSVQNEYIFIKVHQYVANLYTSILGLMYIQKPIC